MNIAKTFFVNQKITAFTNVYKIFDSPDGESQGSLAALVRQKPFAFKEKIEFFADEDRKNILFIAEADRTIDLRARYNVVDKTGQTLGVFKKVFGASIGRSTWELIDNDGKRVALITERDPVIAVLRRVWEFIPIAGSIPVPFRFHFDIKLPNGEVIGQHTKTTWLRDHYRLELSDQALQLADERAWWAIAVMLDALQSR
ncbi:MAG: hypothetical protein JWL85_1017 [Candidatus Saccharibacteria bacterium]|nr:hypothetical protein [Candidatus Saccharibacteria bacterium]